MSKTRLCKLLILALSASLILSVEPVCVWANFMPLQVPPHSIEITADCDVIGTNQISKNGSQYIFTDNISGSIVVSLSDITLDGNGYSLQGDQKSTGIFIQGLKNVTITNLTINNFKYGVVFSYAAGVDGNCSNNSLISNRFTNNNVSINCYISNKITVARNEITNSSKGIVVFDCDTMFFYGNMISNTDTTLRLTRCLNSKIYGNNFVNFNQTSVDPESNSGLIFGWSTITWNQQGIGNYWSNYKGVDNDKDCIGDEVYVISPNDTDFYPRMLPIGIDTFLPSPNNDSAEMPLWALQIVLPLVVISLIVGGFTIYHKRKKIVFNA
ncbi:MAG: NosD domain-containing protein [Candidatus Bathyarchaeia archaeon]